MRGGKGEECSFRDGSGEGTIVTNVVVNEITKRGFND